MKHPPAEDLLRRLHGTDSYSACGFPSAAPSPAGTNARCLSVLPAVKPFAIFPVIRHLPEVCILSDYGTAAVRIITMRHSLSPASFTRTPIGVPCGSLSSGEEEYGLTVFRRFNNMMTQDLPVRRGNRRLCRTKADRPVRTPHLLVQACQRLWLVQTDDS